MSYAVSILVPIYNASRYIEKCTHSLFGQTFENIEYIFVDDCSTDDSIDKLMQVADLYLHRKDNIKIIRHSTQGGSSGARKTALKNATGKYISFVDSDDYIEPDMIETLYNELIKENAQIAVCDLYNEYNDYRDYIADVIPDKDSLFEQILITEDTQSYMCNKLIERTLYEKEDCRIPEGLNYLEDRHVMIRIYYYQPKIVKINKPLYHYIHYNPASITKQKTKMHFDNVLLFWKETDGFLKEKNIYEKYRQQAELSKIKNKAVLMVGTKSYALRKEYADMFRDIEKKYINRLRRGEKIILTLLRHRLYFSAHIFNKLLWYKNR